MISLKLAYFNSKIFFHLSLDLSVNLKDLFFFSGQSLNLQRIALVGDLYRFLELFYQDLLFFLFYTQIEVFLCNLSIKLFFKIKNIIQKVLTFLPWDHLFISNLNLCNRIFLSQVFVNNLDKCDWSIFWAWKDELVVIIYDKLSHCHAVDLEFMA